MASPCIICPHRQTVPPTLQPLAYSSCWLCLNSSRIIPCHIPALAVSATSQVVKSTLQSAALGPNSFCNTLLQHILIPLLTHAHTHDTHNSQSKASDIWA